MISTSRRAFFIGMACAATPPACLAAPAEWRYPADGVLISAEDLAWFRACRSQWIDAESGAPGILPSGIAASDTTTMTEAQFEAYERRLEPLLCAFFLHASFEPGRFVLSAPLDGHAEVEVTRDDIKLLQATSWRHGFIDPKRPYGDYTYFEADMARSLGWPVPLNAKGQVELPQPTLARLDALHRKMQFVLQAYIENARLSPGRWFIPFDGWAQYPRPRCRPVSPEAVLAYKKAMAVIGLLAYVAPPVDLVIPKLEAASALFAID